MGRINMGCAKSGIVSECAHNKRSTKQAPVNKTTGSIVSRDD